MGGEKSPVKGKDLPAQPHYMHKPDVTVVLARFAFMEKPTHNHDSQYFPAVVHADKRRTAVEWMVERLKHVRFDAVAVTGVSGISMGAIVAYEMNKSLVVVRKEKEESHSYYKIEGPLEASYVIVDDLVASGATIKRIVEQLAAVSTAVCNGVICYSSNSWKSLTESSVGEFERRHGLRPIY